MGTPGSRLSRKMESPNSVMSRENRGYEQLVAPNLDNSGGATERFQNAELHDSVGRPVSPRFKAGIPLRELLVLTRKSTMCALA